MKTTTRRQVLATMPAIVTAMTAGAADAEMSADDPVFAAIERRRQVPVDFSVKLTKEEVKRDDAIVAALVKEEDDAGFVWLTTEPTTMAGILASLEYASLESVSMFEDGGTPTSPVCQFPRMIAEALRKIGNRVEGVS
jgi:hypothetical protein